MIRILGICGFAFCLFLSFNTHSQSKLLTLKNERLGIKSTEFYIIEVQVKQSPSNIIGRIYEGTKLVSVGLEGGVGRAIERFLSRNFNASNTDSLMSIYCKIDELRIEEKSKGNNKVGGDIVLKMSFDAFRDGQMINLTTGNATSSYTRSPDNDAILESMIRKMIENQLKGFNKWFSESKKSDRLAQRVRVIFKEDSVFNDKSDTLYYRTNRPLIWADFKGPGRFGSRWAAQVFTSFGFELKSSVNNRVVDIHINIQVWLDKTISWVRPDAKNDYTLAHEQLHFDITKLIAQRFKKKVAGMLFTVEDFSSEIQYQYLEYFRQLSQTQEQYDGETNHGLNTSEQQRWIEKVKAELIRNQ